VTTFSSGGVWQVQGVEEVELLLSGFAGAREGAFADMGGVFLDACEQIERGAGACAVALCFQPHAHDAVEGEGEEADQCMRPDTVGQSVMDRRDLDVGLQDPEAALDVCKAFVSRNSLGRRQIRGIGDQRKFAIKQLGSSHSIVVDRPTEPLGREVGLEEARHLGLSDSTGEAAVRPSVGGAAALGSLAGILGRRACRPSSRPWPPV